MSTPGLVNLVNQLLSTLDESPQRKIAKLLTFNFIKWRFLNETKTLLVPAIIAKSQDIRKNIITDLHSLCIFIPLTSPPVSLQLSMIGFQGTTGAPPNPPIIGLENIFPN